MPRAVCSDESPCRKQLRAEHQSGSPRPHGAAHTLIVLVFGLLFNPLMNVGFAQELFQDGETKWKIYLSPQADPTEQFAAEELQRALLKISEVKFEVISSERPPANLAIIIGDLKNPEVQAQASKLNLSPNRIEQIAVHTLGERLYLAGNQPRGALYAVYRFLQNQLDVRWLWPGPDGEFIPTKKNWRLPDLHDNYQPMFTYRGFHLCGDHRGAGEFREWMARNFINIHFHGALFAESRRGFHCLAEHYAVLPEALFEQHPEYFAEINGRRYKNNICLSTPEVDKIVATTMTEWLRKFPQVEIFNTSLDDNQDYCRCARCAKLDVSTAWFEFNNRLTDLLKAEFPKLKFSTLAYQGYSAVPRCKIRNCELVNYCSSQRCPFHLYDAASCSSNKSVMRDMLAWKASGLPIVNYSYEFDTFFTNCRFLPFFGVIEEAVKNAKTLGQVGMIPEVQLHPRSGPDEYAWAIQSRLPIYLYARLLWNPDLSKQEVLADWCKTVFQEAAAPVLEYYTAMERAWSNISIHTFILGNSSIAAPDLASEKQVAAALASFAAAELRLPDISDVAARERASVALARERVLLGQWNDSYRLTTDSPRLTLPLLADSADFAKSASRVQELTGRPADKPNFATQVRLAWTKDALLVRWTCHDKKIKNLVVRAAERDSNVLQDDSVELILLSPILGETFHLAANSKGLQQDWRESGAGVKYEDWNAGSEVKTRVADDRWEAEMTIPFSTLGRSPNPSENWQAIFQRHNGGRKDFGDAVFPAREAASLAFSTAPRTDRSLLWWVGEPQNEGKHTNSISQEFAKSGWEVVLVDSEKKLSAIKERSDVYWIRRPQGANKVPPAYWQKRLIPAIKNGAIAVIDTYSDVPLDQFFNDRSFSTKCVERKATIPVAECTTAYLAPGDWTRKPNDLEHDLKNAITPAYGYFPASASHWTVLATSYNGSEPAYPYLLIRRYGKGMIVIAGADLRISRSKLLENLIWYHEHSK